jgi:hypothetical protein
MRAPIISTSISTPKSLSEPQARFWGPRLLALGLLALCFAGWLIAGEQSTLPNLTVHEWGTFTAIAGKDGQAIEWSPLNGSTDLPQFVEHRSDASFKRGLRGTIRMETPVLYFYSPGNVTVSVKASFSHGLITEWYPHASVQPTGALRNSNLSDLQSDGHITWKGVEISPNLTPRLPREVSPNLYYAARETSSAPLSVKTPAGVQQEKFLFYRGVSAALLPLSAEQNTDSKLVVRNLGKDEFPAIILFERRGEQVGYRLAGTLTDENVLDLPPLNGSVDTLCGELEGILVNQGLYPDEAHAMVETWRNSWFEEGSRLIYIVPRGFIESVVPLAINPKPEQVVRVFVGRLEIITPATAQAVKAALASNDELTLNRYRRFLEPIREFLKEESDETTK